MPLGACDADCAVRLRRQAEEVLSLREQFPDVYSRYEDVEGLIADVLARQRQKQFMASDAPKEAPGCLLGWLFRRKRP